MSDMIEMFKDLKDYRRMRRERYGVPCPECKRRLPKACPKILLPGQLCRAHKPFYRDPRPEPTSEEFDASMAAHGWDKRSEDEKDLGISGYYPDGSPF